MPSFVMNRRRGAALAVVLLIAALLLAWDWTWFRPQLQNYVRERSQRQIDFDKLRIQLDDTSPRIVFNGLRVQNAPWAAVSKPLITAGEIAFTFSWHSLLFDDKLVVSRLRLVDADVDMERQADGLRNWRLTRPDDRGPGRIKVLTLEALRSRIHVVHGGIALELDAAATPLATEETLPRHADLPLATTIDFSGTLRGTRFDGRALTGRVLSFVDSGVPFGLRGTAHAAGATLQAEGRVVDLIALGEIDADARLTVGHSDAAGRVTVRHDPRTQQRPSVNATLVSERIDVADVLRTPPPVLPASAAAAASAVKGDDALRRRLQAVDAQLDWRVRQINVPTVAPLINTRAQIQLAQGALTVERFDVTLADGHLGGHARLDAGGDQPTLSLTATAHGVHLSAFASRWPQAGQFGGELDAQIAWQARGDHVDALLRSGTGTLAASLAHASIPAGLDAKMALDGAGVVAALFKRGERVAVRCSVVQLDFKNGRGVARQLGFDTERVAVVGRGRVDLADRQLEMVLTPHLHRTALFALQKSVRVAGRFDSPQISLVERDENGPVSTCAPRG